MGNWPRVAYSTSFHSFDTQASPARYFGVPAVGVRSPIQLERELAHAFQVGGAKVIEAVVDLAHYSDTAYGCVR